MSTGSSRRHAPWRNYARLSSHVWGAASSGPVSRKRQVQSLGTAPDFSCDVQISRLVEGDGGCPEDGTERGRLELGNLRVREAPCARREGDQELDAFSNAASVRGLLFPELHAVKVAELCELDDRR